MSKFASASAKRERGRLPTVSGTIEGRTASDCRRAIPTAPDTLAFVYRLLRESAEGGGSIAEKGEATGGTTATEWKASKPKPQQCEVNVGDDACLSVCRRLCQSGSSVRLLPRQQEHQ